MKEIIKHARYTKLCAQAATPSRMARWKAMPLFSQMGSGRIQGVALGCFLSASHAVDCGAAQFFGFPVNLARPCDAGTAVE